MWEFVGKYWLEVLFGVLSAILFGWVKDLQNKLKTKQTEQDALVEGVKALLHDKLFQICEDYIKLGYIPLDDAEKVKNREIKVFKAYDGLHGNSTGTDIHEAFNELPFKSTREGDEE